MAPSTLPPTPSYENENAFRLAEAQYYSNYNIIQHINRSIRVDSDKINHCIDKCIGSQFQIEIRHLRPDLKVAKAFQILSRLISSTNQTINNRILINILSVTFLLSVDSARLDLLLQMI